MNADLSFEFWPFAIALINLFAQTGAAVHAILSKRDARVAAGWVGLVMLAPLIGWVVYYLFGINRIARRAQELRGDGTGYGQIETPSPNYLAQIAGSPEKGQQLQKFIELGQNISSRPFAPGNALRLLRNGDEAYPAMLEAIENAQVSIALATYIFANDETGTRFYDALLRARTRGVKIRVLIDGVGSLYSFPSMYSLLYRKSIPCARFLHSLLPWRMPYLNLRNHKKILVVDGTRGFTGGMNIASGNALASSPPHPIQDTHFAVEGPLTNQLMNGFAHEWNFTTGETLAGEIWFPELRPQGNTLARCLISGPDQPRNATRWTLLGAIAQARSHIRIVTPYFLPDMTLRTNLCLAALRGVKVDIIIPEHSNLFYMNWAMTSQLEELLEAGCRIWRSPGAFDHSKLTSVDKNWCFVGSSNWDQRSFRLNFELNLECYGSGFALNLNENIEARLNDAVPVCLDEIRARSLPVRLRDGAAGLLSPYL